MARQPSIKATKEQTDGYETLNPLLLSMYDEFQELSKKKQDGIVATIKVKMVNRLLKSIHKILENEPNHAFLDLLNEDDLPQNSDVVIILGQTKAAMNAFRSKYWDSSFREWKV